jgi:hypothetical protein
MRIGPRKKSPVLYLSEVGSRIDNQKQGVRSRNSFQIPWQTEGCQSDMSRKWRVGRVGSEGRRRADSRQQSAAECSLPQQWQATNSHQLPQLAARCRLTQHVGQLERPQRRIGRRRFELFRVVRKRRARWRLPCLHVERAVGARVGVVIAPLTAAPIG